jgi:hypothetical protein
MSDIPVGWYPDPSDPLQERLWDGSRWLESTRPLAPLSKLPTPVPPSPVVAPPSSPANKDPAIVLAHRLLIARIGLGVLVVSSALGLLLSGFVKQPQSRDNISFIGALVQLAALLTLAITGARHAKDAQHRQYFVPSAAVSALVGVSAIVVGFVGLYALGIPTELTSLDSAEVRSYALGSLWWFSVVSLPISMVFLLQLWDVFARSGIPGGKVAFLFSGVGVIAYMDLLSFLSDYVQAGGRFPGAGFLLWFVAFGLLKSTNVKELRKEAARQQERADRETQLEESVRSSPENSSTLLEILATPDTPQHLIDKALAKVTDTDLLRPIANGQYNRSVPRYVRKRSQLRIKQLQRASRKSNRGRNQITL